jgi:alcohol dehydrogenase
MIKFKVQFEYGKKMVTPPIHTENVLPHIAIPTTTSGGEYTAGFAIKNEISGAKEIFNYPVFVPRVVILDPELTLETPEQLWLSTGIKAVDHAIESFCSKNHHPITDALAKSALGQLFQYLPRTKRYPKDLKTRLNCQIAAWMSILQVVPNVRFGLSHAIGHQVGGIFNIPHGMTSCVLLPAVLEFNRPVNEERQAFLAESIGVRTPSMSADKAAIALQEAVRNLISELDLPNRLRDFGVPQDQFELVAEHVFGDLTIETNPRKIENAADIIGILRNVW